MKLQLGLFVVILMLLFHVPVIHGIVISRTDDVTFGINSYGNHYYIYHNLGYVDYVNQPGNAYFDAYGSRYRYYYTSVYASSDDFEYIQYSPTIYNNQMAVKPKKKFPFRKVFDVLCYGFMIINALYWSIKGLTSK